LTFGRELDMPSRRFGLTEVEAGLTETLWADIYDDRDNPIKLEAADVILFRIGTTRNGAQALAIRSDDSPPGDSTVVITNLGDLSVTPKVPARVKITVSGNDTEDLSGDFYAAIDLKDSGEANDDNKYKPVGRGILRFAANPDLIP
jgi:hypothetical protein